MQQKAPKRERKKALSEGSKFEDEDDAGENDDDEEMRAKDGKRKKR